MVTPRGATSGDAAVTSSQEIPIPSDRRLAILRRASSQRSSATRFTIAATRGLSQARNGSWQ